MTIQTILRKEKKNQFTQISNSIFNDERLNPGSLGILCYLLSRPDDWVIYKNQLQKRFNIGEDALQTSWNILKKCGYISMITEKNELGQITRKIWVICEEVNLNQEYEKNSKNFSSIPISPPQEKPGSGKPRTTNTILDTKTKELLTSESVVSFRNLKISDQKKDFILKNYSPEEIEIAIDKTLAYEKRISDEAVLLSALKKSSEWGVPVEKFLQSIKEKNLATLNRWKEKDMNKFGEYNILIGETDISFSLGTFCKTFTVDEPDFEEKVKKFVKKIKR